MTAEAQSDLTTGERTVIIVKLLAASLMTLGCVSVGVGVPTVVFGALSEKVHTPYIAGTGLYCGISTVIAGALTLVCMKKLEHGVMTKGYAIAYGVFSQICLQSSNLHLSFNIWGLVTCALESEVGRQCGGANRPALYLLTGMNLTIALGILSIIISVMCLFRKAGRCLSCRQKVNDIKM